MSYYRQYKENRNLHKKITELEELLREPMNRLIIKLVHEREKISAGDIIKTLRTSPTKGLKFILNLMNVGILEREKGSPYLNLSNKNLINSLNGLTN